MFKNVEALTKKDLLDELNKLMPEKVYHLQKIGPSWEAIVKLPAMVEATVQEEKVEETSKGKAKAKNK